MPHLATSSRRPALPRHAFTLIELLIVVAIIAILAAIAVPNFLEAQVRAKVARSQTDMRTLATGIEAYCVDRSFYPQPDQSDQDVRYYLKDITTPVAYISALPKYTWAAWELTIYPPPNYVPEKHMVDYYNYQERFYWEKSLADCIALGYGDAETLLTWQMYDARNISRWFLSAVGPDGKINPQLSKKINWGCSALEYDASNGTVSPGDIIRVGP